MRFRPVTILAFFVSTSLSWPCSAQSPEAWIRTKTVPWPSADPQFTQVVAGTFLGDGRQHAYALADGDLSFAYDFSLHTAVSAVPMSIAVTSLARIPSTDSPVHDELLVAGAGMPVIVRVTSGGNYTQTPILSTAWSNATRLTYERQPAAGGADVAAVAADGQTVLLASWPDGLAPTELTPIAVGTDIDALVLLDWDSDGNNEVALVTGGALRVFERNGLSLIQTLPLLTDMVAARIVDPDDGQRLVLAGNQPDGTAWLGAFDATSATPWLPIAIQRLDAAILTPVAWTGLAACDLNADGLDDLVLSQSTVHGALALLQDDSTSNVFPRVEQFAVVARPGGDATLDSCPVIAGDFNGDGDADLTFARRSSSALITAFRTVDAASNQVPSNAPYVTSAVYDGTNLTLTIPGDTFGDATYLQLLMWHQDGPLPLPAPPLDPVAVLHKKLTIANLRTNPDEDIVVVIPVDPVFDGEPSLVWPNHDHYYVTLRDMEGLGSSPSDFGPFETIAFTMEDPEYTLGDIFEYLVNYIKSLFGDEVLIYDSYTRPDYVGRVFTRCDPPPFEPGEFPDPGPQTGQ